MSRFEALAGLLAGLKGAPASALLAMILAGRPLSQRELAYLTGYSEKPVRRSVRMLLEYGAIREEGPWAFALATGWTGENASFAGILEPYREKLFGGGAGRAAQKAQQEMVGPPTLSSDDVESESDQGSTGAGSGKTGDVAEAGIGRDTQETGPADAGSGSGADKGHETGVGDGFTGEAVGAEARRGEKPGFVVVDGNDLDQEEEDQQQQQPVIPAGARRLARLLRRMGISGRAFERLAARDDLAERPEVVLAWWWYYRALEEVRNPAGAAIVRLDCGEAPPDGYLDLARAWPELPAGIRQEVASLHLHNWSAEQIAATLQPAYPELTAGAVRAYMAVSLGAKEELGEG
jgi:hypothetical protein